VRECAEGGQAPILGQLATGQRKTRTREPAAAGSNGGSKAPDSVRVQNIWTSVVTQRNYGGRSGNGSDIRLAALRRASQGQRGQAAAGAGPSGEPSRANRACKEVCAVTGRDARRCPQTCDVTLSRRPAARKTNRAATQSAPGSSGAGKTSWLMYAALLASPSRTCRHQQKIYLLQAVTETQSFSGTLDCAAKQAV